MSDGVFGSEAPKYWDRKQAVVPVNGKEPIIPGWPGLLGSMPGEAKKAEWVEKYRSKNIGLLLGMELATNEVLVALDVDDDRLIKVACNLVSLDDGEFRPVLAGKRGKKGVTIFARASKSLKSTVLKGAGGLGNIDFLASGKMTVMPPSIHPDTGKPYEVFERSLLDGALIDLPQIAERQIKLLKAAIGSEHAIVLIEGKATHDAGIALVAALIRAGATDEETTVIFTGLLPEDYSGNSLKELPEWVRSAREKGFGEENEGAETQSAQLVALALADGMFLFRDAANRDIAMATLPRTGSAIAYRATSGSVKLWLRNLAYKAWGKPVASHPLAEAISTMEAIGLFDGPPLPVFARVAGGKNEIAVDLGDEDNRVALITPDGWKIETAIEHKFIRGAGFGALPLPDPDGGDLRYLQTFLGLDDHLDGYEDYRQTLKEIGKPTMFVCDVPIRLMRTFHEFSGMALEFMFEELRLGDEFYWDEHRGAGFSIRETLPPSQIVGHYHPTGITDPFLRHFERN